MPRSTVSNYPEFGKISLTIPRELLDLVYIKSMFHEMKYNRFERRKFEMMKQSRKICHKIVPRII